MQKLLVMSVLFALVAIPVFYANGASAQRSLARAATGILVFNFLYMVALRIVYARLGS